MLRALSIEVLMSANRGNQSSLRGRLVHVKRMNIAAALLCFLLVAAARLHGVESSVLLTAAHLDK